MDNCFISTAKLLAKSSLVAKDPNAQYVADALTDAIADSQYIKGDNLLKTRVVSFINNSIWGKDKFFLDWLNFKSGLVKDVISPDKILYYGDTQSGITAINTFKSWASRFAKYISQDINITATANFNKDIHYFGSKKAYDEGLDFAAHNLVANYFDKYRQNRDISSQDNQNIAWFETKFDILRKFLEVYEYYANNGIIKISEEDKQELINRNKVLNKAKAVNKNTKDFASSTINNLKTDRTALRFKQNGLDKESDEYKQIQVQIDDINKQIKEYQDTINYSVSNKYNSYFNILAPMVQKAYDALSFTGELYKLKNFGALAYNLVIRGDDLRKDILDLPIMTNLRHNFEDIDENDKIFAQDGGDESAGNPVARNNDKDESSRNWENNIAADYKQLYGGKLYAYFASFPRLDSVNSIQRKDKSTVPDYSSDTELGTPSYYSPIELINAITAFCPTTSVDKFISAVENLAQRSAYHGLIKLVNDMRADRRFANYIKSCFASNIVNKTMVQINEDGTRVIRTNVAADVKSQLYLTLVNSAREVYAVAIDENDSNKITEFKNILNSVRTTESFSTNFASDINAMNDFVQKYMHKYFPDINSELIEKFLYSAPNKYTLLKEIFDTLESFDKAAKEVKKNRDVEDEKYSQARKNAYIKTINEETGFSEWKLKKGIEAPTYNFDALGFDSFRDPINKLVNIFAEAVNADVQLNSRTATNNMASDLIKNSYLTDFFKTLKYIEENEVIDKKGNTTKVVSYRGAEILKNFLTKNNENSGFAGNDMRFSTILWGIKDENGNVLKKGIFNENNGVISINEDVVRAMNYALDNGIRNQNFNKGVEYDSMTSNDYYISTILAFTNPVNYNYNLSKDELKNYAGFLLRVPSDSANNYIVQLPKYKTSDRFNYNSSSIRKIVNIYADVFQGETKLAKYSSKVDGFYKDTSAYKKGFEYKRPINFTSNIIDILGIIEKDAGINVSQKANRTFDTRKYNKYDVTNIAKKEGVDVKDDHKIYLIPIVYNNLETNNGFVIWELVDTDKNGAGSVIEILDSTSLDSKFQSGYGNFAEAITNQRDTVGNYLDDGAHTTTMDRIYDQNSIVVRAFNQQILQSFSQMANALQAMLTVDKDGDFVINLDTNGLFDQYHYKNGSPVNKDTHTLTGNIFNLSKLFTINDYNALDELKAMLSFYGEDNSIFKVKGNTLAINTDKADSAFIVRGTSKGPIVTLNQNVIANALSTVVPKWLTAYEQYINQENKKYEELLLNAGIPIGDNIHDAILNQTLINMEFDDIFEGSAAFYKDAQTFLKRAKEIQANGYSYGGAVDSSDEYDATPKVIADDIILQGEHQREEGKFIDENNNPVRHDKIAVLNCFRGVTIHNTHTRYDNVKELHDKLLSVFTEQGVANAKELADELASAFGWGDGDTTTANDAQSYITLDEFIRRKWADGTIGEYGDLLYKLKYGKELTKEEFVTLAKKIQAQKNVYFDKQFDPRTNLHYSRFIKNAEFVLIPQFLAEGSGLKELYNIMVEKNIQQVNTLETSKAANKTVLTFWSPNNETNEDGTTKFYSEDFRKALDDATNIETYYYRSLYKQQDFVDHINDAENKAGVQIMKKILDNASTASPKVQDAVKQIQDNFSANIKADFDALMDACGWEVDENGRIHNVGDNTGSPLNFDVFYERAREEAQRLGLDDNFLSFLEVDANNNPILPTWMNSASSKLESIAQSIFNNNITRQTLPGFHAAQVSSIGYKTANYVKTSKKLRYYADDNGTRVIECAVPAWDSNIKKLIAEKGERAALKIINEQGLDKFIGYRIPTEGKQSIGVFKIVEFLDVSQGSTMIVPYEWVTQTGSDFDIDTIYAITYETIGNNKGIKKITKDNLTDDELYSQYFERTLRNIRRQNNDIYNEVAEEYHNLKKTNSVTSEALTDFANRLKNAGLKIKTFDEFNKLSTVEKYSKQQRNNNILDAMIAIMNDDSSLEENMSRSNFDGITETKRKKESLLFGENAATTYSVYNPYDQIRFMQNAIDGRKLKAFSVNRDTFNSLNNILKTKLGDKDIIKIRYNLDKYSLQNLIDAYGKENVVVDGNFATVSHNRIGNSLNNRNVLGRLLTPYSSQTTAHILDAIKEGALYNETDLTFKVFKTLVDVGIDYDTAISFLMQPAITRINEDYQSSNSIFVNTYNSPVTNVIKRLLKELGVRNGASELDIHTAYSLLPQLCLENEELGQLFHKVWGTSLVVNRELVNGDEYLDFNVDALSIEEGQLDDRLINSKDNSAERLVFDLGIALLYRKYNRTAQNLEDIAGCTRPDSFGAKQTIHSTRIVLDNIVEFINPDDAHSSTLLVEVDGRDVSVLQALYPDFKRDVDGTYSLDADQSKYKYLAYFLKYATIPSVTANSQLFDTEGPAFTHYVNAFEAKLGRKFTDEEYQDFKKYTVSQIYYACYSLTMPVTLNDKGMIIPDQSASVDENGVMLTDAQQRANEIKRIFGYEETVSDEFRFNDIDNPTEEELETYKKLTPLQKVNLIKQQYPIGNGIFGEITTRKGYDNEFNSKGYTYNRLTVNTLKKDMYNFYNDFILAFSNTNPVAKLAALDLIKYAYLVEGGRYRNNRISKIIPTDVLLATTNHFGTNLISEFREKFGSLINTQIDMTAEGTSISDMMDNFIRSHSGLLKNINLPKPNSSNNTQTNIGNTFNDCKVSFTRKDEDGNEHSIDSGLIRIPASGDDYQSLIDVLTQRNDNDIRYIKVGYYNSSSPAAKRQYRLYKVIPYTVNKEIAQPDGEREIEAYYLVPMALMDENEVYDYSQNNKYNTGFYSKEFYTALIKKQFGEEVNLNSYQKIATNKNIKAKEVNKNIILNNYNGDGFAGIVSDKIMNAVSNWDYSANKITYVYIPGADKYKIAKLLTGNNKFSPVVQTVKANDGKLIDVKIGVSDSKAIASISKKGLVPSDAKEGEVYVLRLNANDHIDVSSTSKENTGDDTHTTDTGENETSRFGLVYDELSDELNESKNYDDLTNIAKDIADYIEKESRNPNNILDVDARRQLRQNGVSGETMENILQHRSDIYSVAADLIAAKAKNIINEINNFEVDGKKYSIDNPELYDALHNSIGGPEYAQNLYSLLIRAKAFGSAISDIENVYIAEGENADIQNSINSIKNSIASVRQNTKINQAIKYIFNTYIAREYSTNPLIQLKVVDLLDAFGDLDWFDNNFADVLHTNNKLIQVVVKLANTELSRAKLDANSKVQQFKKFLAKIKEDLGVDNLDDTFNKLIDENGKYITAYNKQWEEDKDNLRVAMEDANAKYGEFSVEYQRAKLNRDKWYAENVEQPGVAEYYKLKAQYEEKVLNEAPDAYLRYLELRNNLYNQAENLNELTQEQLDERANWNSEINNIKATNEAIKDYINDIQELNYKYLTQEGNRLWINRKDTMVGVIDKYQKKYPNKEPSELAEMIQEYADAYNWLKANTSYTYNQDILREINKNLSILYGVNEETKDKELSTYKTTLDAIRDKYRDKTDIAGILDARLLSEDEIKQLKDATRERYIVGENGTILDFGLIKNNPWNVIYNTAFNEIFGTKERDTELNKLYTKINSYLIKGVEKTVYHGNITTLVNPILLAKNLTEDKLRELYNLYDDVKQRTQELRTDDGEPKLDKKLISFSTDKALWQSHKKAIKDSTDKDITKTKKEYILKILNDTTKKGKIIPRYSLYGKMRFTSEGMAKYVDTARSDAKQWINNNIEYVPTKYYTLAFDEAKAKGDDYFNDWYDKNHIYNPYTHQVEPLAIWTERRVRPDAINIKNATEDYNPLWFNSDRTFRKEYKNNSINPVEGGVTYKSTPTYDNPQYKELNNTEKELLKQLKQYSDYYAHNYRQRKFVKEGYAPRLYSPEINAKWYAEQIGNIFGFGTRNYSDRQWIDKLEYGKEPPMPFQMYELIKAKGYKKHEILPNKFDYASDEEYNKRLKEVQEYNKQVDIDNAELEKAYINRDWEQVFSTLILQGEEYNAKDNMKDLLFLTLEQLRNQKFYKTSTRYSLNPQVVQDKIKSTIDNTVYKTANGTFGADIFENWMRRYLYSQFHQVNPARKFMDKVQAFTTAKYMMLNLRGGIANVNTGLVNILGEELAGEYFSRNDFVSAEKEYGKSIVGLIGDFINDNGTASNEVSAICRWFDIVDTDQMINAPDTKSKVTATKFVGQVNSLLYSFMGTGEHYMQNSALLAMLNSHRVYLDEQTGKYVVGTFNNYIQGVEIKAFRDLISDENSEWHSLEPAFNRYLDAIRKNKNTANEYETLRKDIVADFIKSDYVTPENGNRRKLANAYINHRKELVENAKKDFETKETVRQQLIYNPETGKEELKASSNITSRQLAELRDKALYVNKKIHGVYDKMGAAKIESKWWGSILMQYHKHIYPGYLKRWRRKGYWNETTQSQEKGSRTSFYDLLISSFRTNQSLDTNYTDIDGIKSLQAIAMKLQDIFTDFTLNYQMLPIWEQQNIRRSLGDICGILAGILMTLIIYALWDDDDIKDSKLLNTGLYLADRLYTESRMYNAMGAYAEASTQWSQPIAGLSTFKDAFKALNLISQWMADPVDFNPVYTNTQYKGQNKFGVLLKRNIPIYRVYQRYMNVANNNKYYRINDNNAYQSSAKNVGKYIHDILLPTQSRAYGANRRGGSGAVGENVFY